VKIDTALSLAPEDPLKIILTDLNTAIKTISKNQFAIVSEFSSKESPVNAPAAAADETYSGMVSLGNLPKRNRVSELQGTGTMPDANIRPIPSAAPPPPEKNVRPEVARFQEAVRKAESSTLVLNLNMGRVPIMSKDAMSNRATLALSAMAAENENRPGSVPSEDILATLDDVLSVAEEWLVLYGTGQV
jgi:hypothetical protein